jgi:hypothetical protein
MNLRAGWRTSEWAGMLGVEGKFVQPAFRTDRLERGFADRFEIPLYPSSQPRGQFVRLRRARQPGRYPASQGDPLDAIRAFQREREQNRVAGIIERRGDANEIAAARGID